MLISLVNKSDILKAIIKLKLKLSVEIAFMPNFIVNGGVKVLAPLLELKFNLYLKTGIFPA